MFTKADGNKRKKNRERKTENAAECWILQFN